MGRYIKRKWRKLAFAGGCLVLAGMAEMILIPYVMERWSHDRQIGILHILLGGGLSVIGAAGLLLFYRMEYAGHGREWKKELRRLILGYLLIQCAAGVITGMAGLMLHGAVRVSYEDTKQILYVLNILWQNLFRVGVVYYMVKRLYGRNWRKDWIEGWRADRKGSLWRLLWICIGTGSLTGLQFLPDILFLRGSILLLGAVYLTVYAAYSSYQEERAARRRKR